jgi:hypothetical protein
MATGRAMKLTGATGEFLVAAELCRLGLMATPFAGNVPHYDIIASGQNGGHLAIQVKAINGSAWQFDIGQFMEIDFDGTRQVPRKARPVPYPNLQIVLVALANATRTKDRFFVMSWIELRNILNRGYRRYLRKRGGIRPKAPGSFHTALSERDVAEYEDRWRILKSALRGRVTN